MSRHKNNLKERTFSVETSDQGALVRIGGSERIIIGDVDEIRSTASRIARWSAHVAFSALEGGSPC